MLTSAGVEARLPQEAERRRWLGKFYYRPPGGESWADVVLRLRSLLADLDRSYPGQRVLLVCHDAVIMLIRYILEGLTEHELLDIAGTTAILNASVSRFVRPGGTGPWQLESFNMADHLMSEGVPVTEHAGDTNVHPTVRLTPGPGGSRSAPSPSRRPCCGPGRCPAGAPARTTADRCW